jgi:hypothetical protein
MLTASTAKEMAAPRACAALMRVSMSAVIIQLPP